jgi:YD repeat-containing protein
VIYTWDAAAQLTAISYAAGSTNLGNLTYGYDLAGHISTRGGSLFQSILPAAITSATYDAANRLTKRTAAGVTSSPTWDTNGNLTSDGLNPYSWDARNRMTGIGAGNASFVYDSFGRRQTATLSGTATSFLYDVWDVAEEQRGGQRRSSPWPQRRRALLARWGHVSRRRPRFDRRPRCRERRRDDADAADALWLRSLRRDPDDRRLRQAPINLPAVKTSKPGTLHLRRPDRTGRWAEPL